MLIDCWIVCVISALYNYAYCHLVVIRLDETSNDAYLVRPRQFDTVKTFRRTYMLTMLGWRFQARGTTSTLCTTCCSWRVCACFSCTAVACTTSAPAPYHSSTRVCGKVRAHGGEVSVCGNLWVCVQCVWVGSLENILASVSIMAMLRLQACTEMPCSSLQASC